MRDEQFDHNQAGVTLISGTSSPRITQHALPSLGRKRGLWRDHLVYLILGLSLSLSPQAQGAGVTIITHGFGSEATNGWVNAMVGAIYLDPRFHWNDITLYRVCVTKSGAGYQVSLCDNRVGSSPADSDSGEIVIELDWSSISGLFPCGGQECYTSEFAPYIAAKLIDPNFIPELRKPLSELPLHFIGHSRGAALVSQVAGYLGTEGVWVDHVTTLDPHPLATDVLFLPMAIYSNVLFADNYYETDYLVHGSPIAGAYNVGPMSLSGAYADLAGDTGGQHANVHLWYHGTIETDSAADDGSYAVPQTWYPPSQGPRTGNGWYHSRVLGGTSDGGTRPASGLRYAGAHRESVTVNASGDDIWPNIEIVDFINDRVITQGDAFQVNTYFEDQSGTATVEIGLDSDANPYNGRSWVLTSVGGNTSGDYRTYLYDSSNPTIPAGTYYVHAKITNSKHTRFYYTKGKLTVNSRPDPGAPTVTITTPTSGDTWTTGSSRIYLYGNASANTTEVTWRNATAGVSGTATGTTSWETGRINLNPGANSITVTARDSQGRSGTDSITVTYDVSTRNATLDATESVYLMSGSPNSRLRDTYLYVGYDPTSASRNERSLVKFNLASIPPGSTINTASLQLYNLESNPSTAPNVTITAYRLTGSWSETSVTWNNQPGYTTANSTALSVPNTTGEYCAWDVTAIASGWQSGAFLTYGFILMSSVENSGTLNDRGFASSREARNPLLKINYSPEHEPPTVTITSPTSQPFYTTTGASIALGGTASDNYTVASVTWANSANGQSGTASGTTSWTATVPLVGGTNQITITATDAAGNTGNDVITVFRPPPDTTPPTVPTNLVASAVSSAAIYLTWDPSTDTGGSGLAGYRVYRDDVLIGTTPSLSYLDSGLSPLTQYCYKLAAYDNATNVSVASPQVCATTQPVRYALTISRNPANGGNVIAAPPPDAEGKYVADTTVSLTASNAVGYSFSSWSGDLSGSVNPISTAINGDKSVVANFIALPPVASFSASPTGGSVPLTVTFTDTSTGLITNRFWNLGNGVTTNTTSTLVHVYAMPGSNTVSLTVTGPGGISTTNRVNYIVVTNAPPAVNIIVTGNGAVFNAPTNLTVTAMASDTNDVSKIELFVGSTNLGSSATSPFSVVWTNPATGAYGLWARAVDALGATGLSAVVNIIVNGKPTVNAGPDTVITLPTNSLALAGTAVDDGWPSNSLSTTWSKVSGAGSVVFVNASSTNTTATFSTIGVYVLRLTANDGAATNSDDVTVNVIQCTYALSAINASFGIAGGTSNVAVTATNPCPWTATSHAGWINIVGGSVTATGSASVAYSVQSNTLNPTNRTGTMTIAGQTFTVIQAGDPTLPTVSLTAPTNGIVTGTILVSATATDNVGVAKVTFYRDADEVIDDDLTAPYSVNFNTALVGDGLHSFFARVFDQADNVGISAVVTVTVDNNPPSEPSGLTATTVSTNQINLSWNPSSDDGGSGVAGYRVFRGTNDIGTTPNTSYSDGGLVSGSNYCYSVAAYDKAGHVSPRSTAACGKTFISMASLAGKYNGLVIQTNEPSHASSGAIRLVMKKGSSFAANLTMGGVRSAFKGSFDQAGNSTNTVLRKGLTPLQVVLELDLTNGTEQITGTVSDGRFIAQLLADRAVYSSTNPLPQTGNYAAVLVPPNNIGSDIPKGYGYGLLTATTKGDGKLSGVLGDGTKIKGTLPVSKYGTWPLYNSLYKGEGSCVGWVTFGTTNDALDAKVHWFRPPLPQSGDPAGVLRTNVTLMGGRYVPPSVGGPSPAGQREVALGGGNLASLIVKTVSVDAAANVVVIAPNTENLKLTLQLTTGQFKGSFTHPSLNKTTGFQGMMLQVDGAGAGYFLGTNESGYVIFEPLP